MCRTYEISAVVVAHEAPESPSFASGWPLWPVTAAITDRTQTTQRPLQRYSHESWERLLERLNQHGLPVLLSGMWFETFCGTQHHATRLMSQEPTQEADPESWEVFQKAPEHPLVRGPRWWVHPSTGRLAAPVMLMLQHNTHNPLTIDLDVWWQPDPQQPEATYRTTQNQIVLKDQQWLYADHPHMGVLLRMMEKIT